jgi:hypothetical protein
MKRCCICDKDLVRLRGEVSAQWENRRYCSHACARLKPRKTIADRLSPIKVDRNGCWNWQASKNNKGYGQLRIEGRGVLAHRLSYIFHKGEIPPGGCILHSCDNPACINPDHLRVGTKAHNTADMMAKGRHRAGNAKLSVAEQNEIRASAEAGNVLAARYGVAPSTITRIRGVVRW